MTLLLVSSNKVFAEVHIGAVETSFQPNTLSQQVPRRSSLSAMLRMQLAGQGMLRARWMIAIPEDPQTNHLLQAIKLTVNAAGWKEIASPPLPTAKTGQYRLSVVIDEPYASPQIEDVTYQVE